MVAAILAEHDVPCPICGYNLRGCEAELCPECACPIDPRVIVGLSGVDLSEASHRVGGPPPAAQ